jgi:hypothetical protein
MLIMLSACWAASDPCAVIAAAGYSGSIDSVEENPGGGGCPRGTIEGCLCSATLKAVGAGSDIKFTLDQKANSCKPHTGDPACIAPECCRDPGHCPATEYAGSGTCSNGTLHLNLDKPQFKTHTWHCAGSVSESGHVTFTCPGSAPSATSWPGLDVAVTRDSVKSTLNDTAGKCAPDDHQDDCTALLAFNQATNVRWPADGKTTLCHWPGIKCNKDGRVDELYLDGTGGGQIAGTIVSELGLLTAMTLSLWLDDNLLSGTIPPELARLTALHGEMSLNSNQLSGTIPATFGTLKTGNLDLSYNLISGTIPTTFGLWRHANSRLLLLNNNLLTGTVPTELGLAALNWGLDLHSNSLSGTIPTQLGLHSSMQRMLDLHANALSGPLPSELGLLTNLAYHLELDHNSLVGTIPEAICNVPASRGVGECSLGANSFSCPLPSCGSNCHASCK